MLRLVFMLEQQPTFTFIVITLVAIIGIVDFDQIIVVQITIADQSSIAVVHIISFVTNIIGYTDFVDFNHSILD
jgi:hypothetical protein